MIFPWILGNKVELNLGLGVELWRAVGTNGLDTQFWIGEFYLTQLYLGIPFKVISLPTFLKVGNFSIRSKSEDGVFGDFLFQYGSYPGDIVNKKARYDQLGEGGVRVSGFNYSVSSPGEKVNNQLIGWFDTFESEDIWEYSLAHIFEYTPSSWFNISTGVQLFRINHLDTSYDNAYLETDSGAVLFRDLIIDSIPNGLKYFTPRSTELMIQMSINPGLLLGWKQWKSSDWSFHIETALLGFKNYPLFYRNRSERLAIASGIHIPSFGFFDTLLFEVQRLRQFFSPYSDFFDSPYQSTGAIGDEVNWSSSILVKKSIFSWMSLHLLYINYPIAIENWESSTGLSYNINRENFTTLRIQFQF